MTAEELKKNFKQIGRVGDIEEFDSYELDRFDLEELPLFVLMDGCLFMRREVK